MKVSAPTIGEDYGDHTMEALRAIRVDQSSPAKACNEPRHLVGVARISSKGKLVDSPPILECNITC